MGISEFLEVGTEILKSSCNQVQENLRGGGRLNYLKLCLFWTFKRHLTPRISFH